MDPRGLRYMQGVPAALPLPGPRAEVKPYAGQLSSTLYTGEGQTGDPRRHQTKPLTHTIVFNLR